jgi:hypothetical protein
MSYQSQAQLEADYWFQQRARATAIQQAYIFKDDQRQSWKSVAEGILRDDSGLSATFIRLDAAGPGIADKVDNGDGTINQENVTDGDLLSLTQASWPIVSDLYFNEDGTPIGG